MKRYAIINDQFAVCDGVFYCRDYAERSSHTLRELFPCLEWEVVEIESGLKPDGFKHLGEFGIRSQLASNANG